MIHLRMAKATAEDIDAAMDVYQLLRAMDDGGDHRDVEGYEDQETAQEALLVAFDRGSLMRVIWGMAVLLDPANEIVDPDSEVLAAHQKVAKMQAEIERLRSGICSGCGTVRARAIEAVLGGGVACCPDCSTLSVDDRNTIRAEIDRLNDALSLETFKVITCGVAATHHDKDLIRNKECYAKTWNSPQADAVMALRDDRDRLRDENKQLLARAPWLAKAIKKSERQP